MTDPIDVSIGEATPLSRRVLDNPLTFQGAVLLVILVRGIPEQHIHRRIETEEQKNRVREGRKKRGEYLIDLRTRL